ncbi:hypothetical protein MAH1_36760 [Sessilibacter sp. MAH1]
MISKLFPIKPKKYSAEIKAEFIETWYFGGYTRTADKIFTDEATPLPPLVFHVFNYEFEGVRYEFKMRDYKEKNSFSSGLSYQVFVNPSEPLTCWFHKQEFKGYIWEPDEEDDEY